MITQPYLLDQLSALRQQGDHTADAVIQAVVDRLGLQGIRQLMPLLSDFSHTDIHVFPKEFQDFYHSFAKFPSFFQKKEIIRATDFYLKHQQEIGMVLGCYSLPYCYLGEDGARVLYFSERIHKDTYNRLKETGNFLRKVMNYDHWQDGKIFQIIFKVRLLHASVRYFSLHSGQWDMQWGMPVNQEDMAGTNLAFSWILLRGLQKLGHTIDAVDERAYLHTWKVIGHLLGIEETLLCANFKEALQLDKLIAQRNFRSSEVGLSLTKSLMTCYTEMAGSVLAGEFFRAQARILLGSTYADMLGIEPQRFPTSVLQAFNKSTAFLSNFYA
ncbi:MAG: oxygenase MpaB family protein [Spirosomataceae bacterium]